MINYFVHLCYYAYYYWYVLIFTLLALFFFHGGTILHFTVVLKTYVLYSMDTMSLLRHHVGKYYDPVVVNNLIFKS